jgi:hypothetical protein
MEMMKLMKIELQQIVVQIQQILIIILSVNKA